MAKTTKKTTRKTTSCKKSCSGTGKKPGRKSSVSATANRGSRSNASNGSPTRARKKATTYLRNCKPYLDNIRADIEYGCSIADICAKYGFNRTNFFKWIKKHVELKEIVDSARLVKLEAVEQTMFHFATDGDPSVRSAAVRAGEIILKAENPDKYVQQDKLKVEGQIDFGMKLNELRAKKRKREQESE